MCLPLDWGRIPKGWGCGRAMMIKRFAAVAVGLALLGGTVAAPAPAMASDSPKYLCYRGTSIPQTLKSNTDPKTCNGIYRITLHAKIEVQIDNRKVKNWNDLVKRVRAGEKSAEKWCGDNPLSCGVLTTIGTTLLGGVFKKIAEA